MEGSGKLILSKLSFTSGKLLADQFLFAMWENNKHNAERRINKAKTSIDPVANEGREMMTSRANSAGYLVRTSSRKICQAETVRVFNCRLLCNFFKTCEEINCLGIKKQLNCTV